MPQTRRNGPIRSDNNAAAAIAAGSTAVASDTPNNERSDWATSVLGPNERISMGCKEYFKPITIQPCTTGIECTTTIANRPDETDVDDDNGSDDDDDDDDDSPNIGQPAGEQTTQSPPAPPPPPPDDADSAGDVDQSPAESDNTEPLERTDDGIDQSAYETSAEGDNGGASHEGDTGDGDGDGKNNANGKNNGRNINTDGYDDKDDEDNNSDTGDGSEDVDGEYEV